MFLEKCSSICCMKSPIAAPCKNIYNLVDKYLFTNIFSNYFNFNLHCNFVYRVFKKGSLDFKCIYNETWHLRITLYYIINHKVFFFFTNQIIGSQYVHLWIHSICLYGSQICIKLLHTFLHPLLLRLMLCGSSVRLM